MFHINRPRTQLAGTVVLASLLLPAGTASGQTPQPLRQIGSQVTVTRRLSVDNVVQLALEQNLGLAIARFAPQVQDIAVSQVRSISEIAKRTVVSDDALSVLVPVLEEIAGYDTPEIRALFDRHGFVIQEWEKVRTDWLTVREHAAAEHDPPMAVVA